MVMSGSVRKVLTIAGSDCSGGAGIQADLKTIAAHGLYGMSVITALTAQNTTGVSGIHPVSPDFVEKQIDMVFQDIFPDAVKIGMLADAGIIRAVAARMAVWKPRWIVLDPVMISTSGSRLLEPEAEKRLTEELLPLASVITPNLAEGEALSGRTIRCRKDMEEAAAVIAGMAPESRTGVLLKGGHLTDAADDLLYADGCCRWFPGERIENPNTHGTGCTLSSAIACRLAEGYSLTESAGLAKEYVAGALHAGLDLGHGSGPLDHMWKMRTEKHVTGKSV